MDLHLPTPTHFPAFPYSPPYDIQTSLMRHLYQSIEDKKVTIIESPTGTGKTLSLLCAALTWLADERERAKKGKLKEVIGDDGVKAKDWVVEQTIDRMRREMEADEQEYEQRLMRARKREEAMRRAAKGRVIKRTKITQPANEEKDDDDNLRMFLPETDREPDDGAMHISPALKALMEKVDKVTKASTGPSAGEEEELTCTKIYYASRTHSQLSQVLPEMSKLKLPAKIKLTDHHTSTSLPLKRGIDSIEEQCSSGPSTRAVSLGSRRQLCINDALRASALDLDEACRERLGEKEGKRCQYLPPIGEEHRMLDFRDQILASPKDIEDLAEAGRLAHTCPYFGSRRAIPQAELVTLPYNLLLQKSAREALGIDLKNQVVLIDEAHNLIPTLLSLSTTRLSYATLLTSFQQVCVYVSKFKTRLSPTNMIHLKKLVLILDSLKKYVEEWKISKAREKDKSEIMTSGQLMERLGRRVAGINLLEIGAYLKESKVARKIAGYSDKVEESNKDGRITFTLIESPGRENTVEMRYQLLNPSPHFQEVVEEARSVVLAGGTMSPISDVINQLFSYLPSEKVTTFSCGHIIPETNLQTLVISKGPTGGELDFRADKQADPTTIGQLGQVLLNFANIIPAGMIVFFPSYKFLRTANAQWKKSTMLEKFATKKEVFFEPEESSQVEKVLQDYALAIKNPAEGKKGALLFAVIGAKLSEGLNFADDLARGVVIVGLPFANLGSPELRERMKYVKSLEEQKDGASKQKGQKDAAAELYENMCMNAVNQSIGIMEWLRFYMLVC
ncbi:ATP-dependent DNA helicase CHL1 [Psilocybe cubensis]|uniref:ATP-dependent DNA helicase CHL1 n=1 Tax=Psilocybe cubensis TaxID=181762 RepID=A0ACB8GYI3_PSICU|nr:ATP-dependent DNA helicase CHL1 [Psilocybe cubensis]KAH9480540.1 ATP-dependent DNA helicase CHL1 [Psilocybe cubensis]